MSEAPAAPIGHNRAPVTEIWKQENLTLAQRIADDNKALSARKTALLAECETLPKVIKNDEQSGIISDMVKKLRGVAKDAEAIRVSTKEPALEACRIVDALFKKFQNSVDSMATELNKRGTAYDLIKEDKARQELEAAAQKAREEEDRARAAAEKAAKGKNVEKTVTAAEKVSDARSNRVEAERAAEIAPAELTRTRGEASVSSLIEIWHGEVQDFEKIDLNALRKYISRSEIEKAAERAGKDLQTAGIGAIKFLRIFSTKERRVG